MKKNKSKIILSLSIIALLLSFVMYLYFENIIIETTEINIANSKIPAEFNEYKIVHISDLHNAEFGSNNKNLLGKIEKSKPDVIFITGDIIDSKRTDVDITVDFLKMAIKIAPIYYVTGNHEASTKEYSVLTDMMKSLGVCILDNMCTKLKMGDSKINLIGFSDPSFVNDFVIDTAEIFKKDFVEMNINSNYYTILLSHRPEAFDFYVQNKIDLVFSGHAHGGQFRLPFIGGVIAPNQGLFPEYTEGIYEKEDTKMIVSRGLGNIVIPFRINNNPEIVVVTLKSDAK